MKAKISKFLNRVELDGKIYYYNSLTNALVELSSSENETHMLNDLHMCDNSENLLIAKLKDKIDYENEKQKGE